MDALESPALRLLDQPSYPTTVKEVSGTINGEETDVYVVKFCDKIMITISQHGRLAQWLQVPLEAANPARGENFIPSIDEDNLLPMSQLTATTLLGAGSGDREVVGHLFATHIASAIAAKDPDESRTILLGFGFTSNDTNPEQFFDLLDLVTQCL